MRSFKKLVHITLFGRWFTGISRLLWDWRKCNNLAHVSRYSINRFENWKANASKETQNIILRCLNYYACDKPFYLLVYYLSVRFPTTDALEVIRKILGMKAKYFIYYDYGDYGYKEHYAYGEIKVMVSDDEHTGVFLELKGAAWNTSYRHRTGIGIHS